MDKLWKEEQRAGKMMMERRHERYCQKCQEYKDERDFVKLKLANSDWILCTNCTKESTKEEHIRNIIIRKMNED
jgi:hypothetical protein